MSTRILSAFELGVLGRTILSTHENEVPDFEDPRIRSLVVDMARNLFRLSRANLRAFRACYQGRHWLDARMDAPSAFDIETAICKAKPDARGAVEHAMMLHYNTATEVTLRPFEAAKLGEVMSRALGIAHTALSN